MDTTRRTVFALPALAALPFPAFAAGLDPVQVNDARTAVAEGLIDHLHQNCRDNAERFFRMFGRHLPQGTYGYTTAPGQEDYIQAIEELIKADGRLVVTKRRTSRSENGVSTSLDLELAEPLDYYLDAGDARQPLAA